ncbi:MAG TPA: hypothetical protein VN723_01110 [Rhizomicrobium sp.]|nr:hypothetical protein [Rhizomicrobium sp.]
MQNIKSIFGVAKAVLPVLYCGYLLYYFLDVGGSVQGVEETGLGPTVIGLGAVGGLFCIPLILKIVRLIRALRSPGSGGSAPGGGDSDDGGAAADAVIARYMARKSAEDAASNPATATPLAGALPARAQPQSSGIAKRPGFGRRSG